MNIEIGDTVLTATLVDNSSVDALKEALSEGPISIDMRDYGNMEKVGSLGMDLPRNDEQITTEVGDIILYQGSAFVIYYAPNSWNFTRLGKIDDVTTEELREILGEGDVTVTLSVPTTAVPTPTPTATFSHPLQIEVMRQQSYPGSPITIEQTLAPGANYDQHVVSYQSDGYKIYALMTIPNGMKPNTGWPAIVFNHGYIPPTQYRTTGSYGGYVDAIARSGYIVLKPDLRGHGNSEGSDSMGDIVYATPAYTVDVLNAVASLQGYEDADPNRIGMWGHSMGGQLTLRAMVVSQDIKAGVIWAGDIAPYPDVVAAYWGWDNAFIAEYGSADQHPDFWASVSPNTYLSDLSGPLELHHSTTDAGVPVAWSEALAQELDAAGQTYEFYTYPGDNHNISANFGVAMQRTVAFFDQYVKGQ